MIKTLQKKFIFSAMLAITILLVILLGAINIGNLCISRRQSGQTLKMLLSEQTMQPPPDEGHKGFLDAPMDENFRMSAVFFTVRVDRNGELQKVDTGRIADVSKEEAARLCREVMAAGSTKGTVGNFRYQMAESQRDGSRVYLFLDTSIQLRGILRVLFFSLAAGLAGWLAMLLLVVIISKRAIRPIAENISRQKQFVTDAGHEIKTPLAIILANTEAMELYQGESKWSKNIREQTLRLNGLMQNLLSLAKAEESGDAAIPETVSLTKTVSEGIRMFQEGMTLKRIALQSQIESGIDIRANREQLRHLISILLDNAVKYTVPGGNIAVSLERRGKAAVFRVENTCASLPDCPPEKLFDRFYRGDAARTQEGGGYGIGLFAAAAIVRLHGGQIKATYLPPDKIAFTVTF